MMIYRFLFLFVFFYANFQLNAQSHKTKILLVGTIHFETPHKDKFELKAGDFMSKRRQQELDYLTKLMARTKASKVMIERPTEEGNFYDSLYQAYLNHQYSLTVSEREQIGFRLAKELHLSHINCVDQLYGFPHDSIMFSTMNEKNENYLLDSLKREGQAMMNDYNHIIQTKSVIDILKYINTNQQLCRNLSLYLKFFAKVGAASNLSGAEYVADWYTRNLAIYSTILNQIDHRDDYVIVILGQGHIQILKHLFENNPDFEVVDLNRVLN